MSAQSPHLSNTADTVPGRRGALTAGPSQDVLALSLDEASVKIRTGPPDDGDSLDAGPPARHPPPRPHQRPRRSLRAAAELFAVHDRLQRSAMPPDW
jgi:hypothetical protein